MAASEAGSAAWPGRLLGGGSSVSVVVATAIVVADMVGVGVFTSLGFQVKDIPSGFAILLLWTVGGIVALCGAVWLVSIVQLTGVRHSSTFQLVSTILKVVLIVAFLVAGVVVGTPQPISFAPDVSDFGYITSAPFAIGLVFVF